MNTEELRTAFEEMAKNEGHLYMERIPNTKAYPEDIRGRYFNSLLQAAWESCQFGHGLNTVSEEMSRDAERWRAMRHVLATDDKDFAMLISFSGPIGAVEDRKDALDSTIDSWLESRQAQNQPV